MPDTKSGRERKGRNKRRQLEFELASRDAETMDELDEAPELKPTDAADAELLENPNRGEGGDD
ncbi:MAG: hypothetical protein V5A38_04750 [Halolamina sp.]|uniref:hypothetical protein n=1 Tax=Halolamina sp. TaxID=1940283 RepID=UPI002FC341DB